MCYAEMDTLPKDIKTYLIEKNKVTMSTSMYNNVISIIIKFYNYTK